MALSLRHIAHVITGNEGSARPVCSEAFTPAERRVQIALEQPRIAIPTMQMLWTASSVSLCVRGFGGKTWRYLYGTSPT